MAAAAIYAARDKKAKDEKKKKRVRQGIFNQAVCDKLQMRFRAACYGTTPAEFFAKYDFDGNGTLDAAEFHAALASCPELSAVFHSQVGAAEAQ